MPGEDREANPIESFPDEIIVSIFKCLDITVLYNVSQVCSRWQTLAKKRCFWVHPRIGSVTQDLTHVLNIWKSMGCLEMVEILSLHTTMSEQLETLLLEVTNQCRNLRFFSLTGPGISYWFKMATFFVLLKDSIRVPSHYMHTRSLSSPEYINFCFDRRVNCLQLTKCSSNMKASIISLYQQKVSLENLLVEVDSPIIDPVCNLINKHASSLRRVHCEGIITESLLNAISTCSDLEHLSLYLPLEGFQNRNVAVGSLLSFERFETRCQSLKVLVLINFPMIRDEFIIKIANQSPILQICKIHGNIAITNTSIDQLIEKCINLEELHLVQTRRVDFFSLIDSLRNRRYHCTWNNFANPFGCIIRFIR